MRLDLDMAQYAGFVWSAWGISALVLVGLVGAVWRRSARARKALSDAEGGKR
jgi:heme exporter protein CcmD